MAQVEGITDVQRNTPPWARGVPFAAWMARNGVQWNAAEVNQHYELAQPEKATAVKQQAAVAAPLFAEVSGA